MIRRKVTQLVRERLKRYPAVALFGPRQCGKTTLAQALKGRYFDLEVESDRLRLDLQWEELIKGNKLVILDEAQSWPDVFPRLRSAIDQDRKRMGRFLLLGSVSPALSKHVSESLAGRLSLVELTPFLLVELPGKSLDDHWLFGGYPDGGILDAGQYPHWQQDYLSLLIQRDLPDWGLPAKPQQTNRLMRMLVLVQGQMWNASQIGQSLGLSYKTVNQYMDYLLGSYLIRFLQPFEGNLRKRLVKRPKIYWRDTGLLHSTMQTGDMDTLLSQPWVGASWEGFVIEQILGLIHTSGKSVEAFFLRTSDQYEIDLVLDFGRTLWAIEAKLTASPSVGDMKRLNKAADFIHADKRILVSRTPRHVESGNTISTNLPALLKKVGFDS